MLHEWLQAVGHTPDDRLCTTLIRVCAQHGQAATALGLYDWMRTPRRAGGAGLVPTVYTYTAALRAALSGNMIERAYQVPLILGGLQEACLPAPCSGTAARFSLRVRCCVNCCALISKGACCVP